MKARSTLLLLLVLWLISANRYSLSPATITVHADKVLAPVNPLLFGQNFGPWMNTTPEYIEMYKQAGVRLLRFPGGNYGDENDLYPNNLDDLAALAKTLNAEVVVQARSWREGTPEKAAALVRYCNLEHDYGFRYWEVGNEPDLYKNRFHRPGDPLFDVDWYNARFREYATAMKAVDPTIKIVGPVVSGSLPTWFPAFLRANGDIVDVLSWHFYGHGNERSDASVLTTPADLEWQVKAIRNWWKDPQVNPLGYQRTTPPLFLSEYNVSWATHVRRHLGSQVGALWNAEIIGRMANLGVEMAAHFALQGTDWQGLIGMLKDPRPVYDVYQLYSRWGEKQVAVTASDEKMLAAFASQRKDGKLMVMVLNKNADQAITATIALEGFRPRGTARVWLQDESHPAEELERVKISQEFQYTFPPFAVVLFEMEPSPAVSSSIAFIVGVILIILLILKRKEMVHKKLTAENPSFPSFVRAGLRAGAESAEFFKNISPRALRSLR